MLESVAAGKSPRAYLAGLILPRGSPPFTAWIAIGILYYVICAILLYRLLALAPDTFVARAALALLLVLMAANAFWNYLFFRRRSPRAGYLAFLPYTLLALALASVLFLVDPGGAWILLPYLGYLVYALWWSRRVWQLNRTTSLLMLLCWFTTGAAQTPAFSDQVDRFVKAELARQHIPGISVAVLRGDSVVLARGYGFANLEHRAPAADSTVYAVGSVSKQFTAAAIVLLSEQGRLGLDDPITRYLPEGSAVWSEVTIRHLLTHTSGIPQDTTLDSRRDYSESELVRSAARPLQFKPGELESYSSTGYALLGVIIHRVTGLSWGDFVRDHIFRPLGMRTARVNSDADIVPNRAAGYYLVNDTLKNQDWASPSINSTADCCLSLSVRDFAHWAIGLNHGKVLGRAGLEMSWTPVRLNNAGTYPYGFGWNLLEQRGYRRIGHSGAWRGSHATVQRYPDFNLTVIVLLNLAQANSEGIAVGIAGLFEPALTPPHLLATRLKGATPPKGIDQLLRAIASGSESRLVTPELNATFPGPRRELIAGLLQAINTWTPLGCDDVRDRGITRLRSRIEHICYAKGTAKQGSLLFTVLYASGWRAAGLDNFFGI